MSSERLTLQDAILRLESFWADQGCLVWQPHNVEVGAGTLNPATFLHVLGPEPWNVVYVEPSIRPDDGRYAKNPNRMARHHQIQVILKPDPGDPQQLFLNSLAVLGVDLARRDVRFVEDNWESPALGAWGLGWEVWLDGLEITQFTYFQQAGSLDLDPVSVEITYGLDRIMMALQDVRHFKDLAWSDRVRASDVHAPMEVETSRYFFETANVERLRQLYELYEAESGQAIADGLPYVAHDYVLKCSHVFNILDSRGAVGVTERAGYFARMRRMSREVAELYVAIRQAEGLSLLDRARPWVAGAQRDGGVEQRDATPAGADGPGEALGAPADFLLEVGTEELPVADVDGAIGALAARVPALLDDQRLAHGNVHLLGTPRRLALIVERLSPRQADLEEEIVGPPASAAFATDGSPTPAAEGFARSAGVSTGELRRVTRGGQERVAATRHTVGRSAGAVLSECLPQLLAGLTFQRSMRWDGGGQQFSRPVRWLVALHGAAVVHVRFAGLAAGRVSRGLRSAGAPALSLAAAGDYRQLMRTYGIEVDPDARRHDIERQVEALAGAAGGHVPDDPELVAEVTNLVERPHAVRGDFERQYLELPPPVLTTVLKKHQRTFPVVSDAGDLLPHFITVANGQALDIGAVRHGNEAVVRARFADAAYFWKRDTSRKLDEFTPALAGLTFQAQLGSVLDKVTRLRCLVPLVGARLGLDQSELAIAVRAAELAKSDLATEMVVDFTSLQGVMGREYALLSGEAPAVASAIYEQYLPRCAGDELPRTPPGIALALADRLDSLVGLFAVGMKPTGAADPYALRRAALGAVIVLVESGRSLDLASAVDDAAAGLPVTLTGEARSEVLEFLGRRLEVHLRECGRGADAVAAVLAVHGTDPACAAHLVATLAKHEARPDWLGTLHAYARCLRIVRPVTGALPAVDPEQFVVPAEAVLNEAVDATLAAVDARDLDSVLRALATLAPTINRYFDDVLVMADDPAVRANRLSTVKRIADLPAALADLSLLEGF